MAGAKCAVAIFPYTARNDQEISFLQGDTILLLSKVNKAGWIKGKKDAAVGWFPAKFAKIVPPGYVPPTRQRQSSSRSPSRQIKPPIRPTGRPNASTSKTMK